MVSGGRVVDPTLELDALRDVRIAGGRIVEIGEHLAARDGERVLDASGAIVTPGFVDMHVHLRDPGFPNKETLETGTQAAVRGGFTSVACMPNTSPALDDVAIVKDLIERSRRLASCRVYPIAAMTLGRKGREACDYVALAQAGAVGFSDDGDTVADAAVMVNAAEKARGVEPLFISHCDPEEAIAARDCDIAGQTGKRWHIAHCSTKETIDLVKAARERGVRATCEVTPHHLNVSASAAQREMGAAARVHPSLRSEEDVTALRRGVMEGIVDAFASDHAPHTQQEKNGLSGPPAPGFSGLEIALGAYALALPELPMPRFVELISTNPARILGIPGGTLEPGSHADVTIFARRDWIVDPSRFASKGKSTPFSGWRLPYLTLATIVDGEPRYFAPEFAA